jgi:hypothetical protein
MHCADLAFHQTVECGEVRGSVPAHPPQSILDALQSMVEALRGPDYQAAYQQAVLSLCLPTDDETRKTQLIASLPKAPQHVVASAFTNHVTDYDGTPAAAGCHVPIAYIGSYIGSYIGAAIPATDLIQFRSLTPHLLTAETLGSGHFSPLFVGLRAFYWLIMKRIV